MKTLTSILKIFSIILLLSIFWTTNLSALVLDEDNFSSYSWDGWSRDDGDSDELQINQDQSSHKTFNFGASYTNAEVTVTFSVRLYDDWESSDRFRIDLNGAQTNYYGFNTATRTITDTITTNLDSSGNITIEFSTNTSSSSEKAYIDFVRIEYTATVPVITPETFIIYNQAPTDTVVGTISSTGSPNSFAILSGDIDNIFAVSSNGDISIASNTNLENNTTSTYTLEINASNVTGYDVENFIINLTDDIELSTDDINTRAFTNVPILGKDSVTINGSILQIGNQLLCKNSADGAACEAPSLDSPNNDYNQHQAKIDTSDGAPSNNTMAKLVMESGDKVIFARLYWSARINNITSTQKENAKTLQIKGPNATTYTSFTSPNSKYNWHKSGSTFDYVASQDVTEYIKAQGAGNYYAGAIVATNGSGMYASWQLIVVVENSSRSLKNISIFDGFYSVYDDSNDYPDSASASASGFITPTGSDPFNANLFIYMGESDSSYGDSVQILKKDGNEAVSSDWLSLVDGADTSNDVVNASIYSPDYTGGYRSNESDMANPNFRNVLGVDIDKLPINIKEDVSKQKLSNSQTSTKIKISSKAPDSDRFSLNMFAFETEVFVPEFCYDYAYSQYDQYFTEDNDGSNPPSLTGDVTVNEPIKISIFIKSMVDSSITIDNMSVDISDINRTQATYITDSTLLAKVGDATPDPVAVTAGISLDGTSDYINNIFIGTLQQNDYFYIYYNLDPKMATMDIPINVVANYDLTLDATSVAYSLKLSEDIPLCTTTNFNYTPAKGIFNVAHNNYYTFNGSSGNKHYNIPTQVTKREGNFKVLAMDPDDRDSLLSDHPTTIVAVEMIDAGAFHYTDASCKELESSISEKVWVIVDANSTSTQFNKAALESAISDNMTKLTNSYDFYTKARQNTAFRITYNASDSNGSITSLTENASNDYSINNFTYTGLNCLKDMNDNNTTTDDAVNTYCTSNMTKAQLTSCMECIYGADTRFICSRDNFAIRPEAFMIKIDDQNQTNHSSQLRIADDVSGVITPSTAVTHLAAGYQYNLEVNATNHLGNTSSFGYTKYFTSGSGDTSEYLWSPTGVSSGCNDESNSTVSFSFLNGKADLNTSLNQIGEYILHMQDTTWTAVDNNSLYMSHHDGDATYFISSATPDCILNDSTTQVVNSSTKNGCNIKSNHNASATSLKYRDYNIEFHPYKFDLTTIAPTIGLNHAPVNANSFVYMSDMSFNNGQDQNMSYHLNGNIRAYGENNFTLSNFVNNCYAVPLDISINKSAITLPIAYKYRFHSLDQTGAIIRTDSNDLNTSTSPISVTAADFPKELLGSANTIFNLNYDRTLNNPQNPEVITYNRYDVNCTNDTVDCTFNADLLSKTSQGTKDLNSTINIKHYYGRSHAPRQRYQNTSGTANIYFEVYCFGTIGGNTCNKSLLQDGLTSRRTNDLRWFINTAHTTANGGNIGTVIQKGGTGAASDIVDAVTNNVINPSTAVLTYDASFGYPYKTTMENNASRWLIYNEDNPTATRNEFSVEFDKAGGSWSGSHETDTVTKDQNATTTNRRSMW